MQRLASRGYVVMATALRGEGGSEGKPNLGAGDRNDVLNLIEAAAQIKTADTSKIGLWGFSRGAGLSYRVLAATDRIQAAVLIGGPSDAVLSPRRQEFDQHVYPGIVDNYELNKEAALKALSANYWPEKISENTPILLIHGAADKRVRLSQSLTMANHFARLGRNFGLFVADQGSHSLIEVQPEVRRQRDRWFDKYLKGTSN